LLTVPVTVKEFGISTNLFGPPSGTMKNGFIGFKYYSYQQTAKAGGKVVETIGYNSVVGASYTRENLRNRYMPPPQWHRINIY